jgi:ABC-type branched-subunit amino acid transport system ATPase component
MSHAALQITGLHKNFGALQVARDINFSLAPGARHALIGPNGAGKTTFVNLVTGVLRPSSGSIHLRGRDITPLSQAQRSRRGLARTFQINQLFRGLTILENFCMAIAERTGAANKMLRPLGRYSHIADEAIGLLQRLQLKESALKPVRELAYGQQRLVEIAIALAQQPTVLLLDEPAAGVPSSESRIILDVIETLGDDISIMIIEHDMEVVFRFAERITVLVSGSILTEGTPAEIAADEQVRAVYLGEG